MATKKKQATQARGVKAPRASSRARAERAREEAREKKRERDRAYRARKKAEAEEAERKRLEALERRRERDRARREAEREAERKRLEALERRRERDRARRAAEKAERERLEAQRKQRRRERDRARREAERAAERKRLEALERRRERDRARRAAEREERERQRKKEEKKKRDAERKRKKRAEEKQKREVCADLFREPSTVPEIVWGSTCFYRSTPNFYGDGTFGGEIVELAGSTQESARKAWDRIEQFTRAYWAESRGYWMRTGTFGTPPVSRSVDQGKPGDTSARRKERQFGRASLPASEGHYTGWKRIGRTPGKRTKWTTAAAWRLGGRKMARAMVDQGWRSLRVVEEVFTGREMPDGF